MQLGHFSVSLAVKDIHASLAFYEALGFQRFPGCDDPAQGWLILQNGSATIGLFQGMFEKNTLTFNPGWDEKAQPLAAFTDVRELQQQLQAKGISITTPVDPASQSGPAYLVVVDPDGNPLLIDQHR